MRQRNRNRETVSASGDWLHTYAAAITLILCVLVLLVSISTVDQKKLDAFMATFAGISPAPAAEEISQTQSASSETDMPESVEQNVSPYD